MIKFLDSLDNISSDNLKGFFVGWENPPSPDTLFKLLKSSDKFVIAYDEDNKTVAGFVTAITDNVLTAYIPFLEVLPNYQKQGIGKELMEKIIEQLKDFYMLDLICDKDTQDFYSRFNMQPAIGMILRNYKHQSGKHG